MKFWWFLSDILDHVTIKSFYELGFLFDKGNPYLFIGDDNFENKYPNILDVYLFISFTYLLTSIHSFRSSLFLVYSFKNK